MFKNQFLLVLITFLSAFLFGCQLNQENTDTYDSGSNYKPALNDVIEAHGRIENIDRLNLFVENVQSENKDKVRLVRYTIEGDPIFFDLDFHDNQLTLKRDDTEDKFGQGEVRSVECKSIQKQESDTETKYILDGCPNDQMSELLSISHDVDNEDYFAFSLKYGVGKKNIINTKNQELIKDLQNGETVAVSDFQFSKEEMNKIYKLMIFSDYLGEKSLSKECNQKPHESYELNIWINSAERHFEWTECDKKNDGIQMTGLVQNILNILMNTTTYQSLPDVKGAYE